MSAQHALRILLNVMDDKELEVLRNENEQLKQANKAHLARLKEAKQACPVLFAEIGDYFMHPHSHEYGDYDYDVFAYMGRKKSNNWLLFEHVYGDGLHIVNGGLRDLLGAWPIQKYSLKHTDGTYDEDILCLPPKLCGGFEILNTEINFQ